MSLVINQTDLTLIEQAKKKEVGALVDITGHRIASSEGTIFVGCSDGDQFADLYDYHKKVCHCDQVRHHGLMLNGGALLLSDFSPIPDSAEDGRILIRHISGAVRLKGIQTLVLYVHAPCGAGHLAKLTFLDVLCLQVEAKIRLRLMDEFAGLQIVCFFHIDFGSGKKKTYFVNREASVKFLRSHGKEVRV